MGRFPSQELRKGATQTCLNKKRGSVLWAKNEKGKAPSTQAGEFVREEIHHIREGKHGVCLPNRPLRLDCRKPEEAGVPSPASTWVTHIGGYKAQRGARL